MLYSWMFKGSTFSSISTEVRCILKSKQLATSRHFHETFRNTSEVMSTQDVNLNPPDSVRGMIKLNRDIFNKIINVSCVCLPCNSIKKVSDCLKKYSLRLQHFKPLCDIDSKTLDTMKNRGFDTYSDYKMIILDPRKVNRYCDIGEADRLLLEANGVGEEFFCQHDLSIKYDNWKADEVLRAVIPAQLESVSGYSLVGHIVHLNLREELAIYRGLIGEVLLDKVKCARTVVNKIHNIHSTYRNFKMEVLAGEEDFVTTVRENKCTFEFDFSQVYWNPRLSTEHERIVNMLESGDVLYDVFCGVGPFCIPAAKKGCRTLANDLNPHSIKWLKINLKHNKIKESNIHICNKDGCDFIKEDIKSSLLSLEPGDYNIKIVMNLPAIAPSFLIHFKQLFSEEEYLRIRKLATPSVFVYCFSKGVDKHEERAKEMVEKDMRLNLDEEITEVFFVRNVAPNKEMMRVTLLLTEKILLNRKRAVSQEEEVNLKKVKKNEERAGGEEEQPLQGASRAERPAQEEGTALERASQESNGIRTCGIIVIGDEVLKGQVADQNVGFLAPRLHSLGIKLKKVSIIADLVDEIAREVAYFSYNYDSVITTGGIGPTHDDLTYEGIAAAFNEPLALSQEIVQFWSYFTKDPSAAKVSTRKFATIPKSSLVLYPQVSKAVVSGGQFPVVVVRNVVVLPGVPSFVEAIFDSLEGFYFKGPGITFHGKTIYLKVTEEAITECLNETVKKFSPSVQFGSYPKFGNCYYKVQLTLESERRAEVELAHGYLMSRLDQGWVAKDGDLLGNAFFNLSRLLKEPRQAELARVLHESIQVIEKCLDEYDNEEVFLSFNGGKDCTALLHLIHTVLVKRHGPRPYPRLTAVYFRPSNPFKEVENFIHETANRYNVNLITEESEIKEGLGRLMKEPYKKWKACFVGVRRVDPKCTHLSSFQATDEGWPPLIRVSPLLDWTYQDVWTFLRELSVPYCCLYDRGYTSLGNAKNTRPNPALEYTDKEGRRQYRAAHTLEEERMERRGRVQEQVRHTTS